MRMGGARKLTDFSRQHDRVGLAGARVSLGRLVMDVCVAIGER